MCLSSLTLTRKKGLLTMDPIRAEAIHNERHVKVVCVGAGASGLCLAYKLQRSFQNYDLTVRYL